MVDAENPVGIAFKAVAMVVHGMLQCELCGQGATEAFCYAFFDQYPQILCVQGVSLEWWKT